MSYEVQDVSNHSESHLNANASLFDEAYEAVAQQVAKTGDWIQRTAEAAGEKLGSLLLLDEDDDFDEESGDLINGQYGFGEDGSEVTINDDGSTVTVTADGKRITEHPDGRVETQ